MKINFNVQGKARGKLVNIIAEAINETATYLKAPSYAYEIGAFTMTREGELEFDVAEVSKDDFESALDAAKAAGFAIVESEGEDSPETAPETEDGNEGEDSPETAAEIETQAEGGDSPEDELQGENEAVVGETGEESESLENALTISFPKREFTEQTLDNLEKMVISKAPLIKSALGADNLPIQVDGDEVKFPWFAKCEHADMMTYAQFIERLCKTAQAKQRVTATAPESYDNPRFSMRVWLISLGMKGAEYADIRRRLISPLSGNSGYRYEDKQPRNPRGGERVHKEVVSVRFTPEMLEKLAELASQSNMSRNALIESVVSEYVQAEFPASEVENETE